MAEAPRRGHAAKPGRRRGEAGTPDDPEAPSQVRMYVAMDPELHRKIVTYCSWHRISPSALVSKHLEPVVRGFFVQHRSGAAEAPTVRIADAESA